jgi:hypothetical protein
MKLVVKSVSQMITHPRHYVGAGGSPPATTPTAGAATTAAPVAGATITTSAAPPQFMVEAEVYPDGVNLRGALQYVTTSPPKVGDNLPVTLPAAGA